MKTKNIIALAIAAITILPITANARGNNNRQERGERQARTERKADKGGCCMIDSAAAFKDITLTDKQRSEIAKINAETRADMKARREQRKADNQARCEQSKENCKQGNGQCNNSCDKAKNRDQTRTERREQGRQYKLDYLHKIKNVLTESQYITFLENTVTHDKGNMCGHNKPGKPGKAGDSRQRR